jgi:hypothetical protein
MQAWSALILAMALGACISETVTSPATTECCIIGGGADAGGGPSCWCGSASSASGVSYSAVVTGGSCTVTITEVIDGGSSVRTLQGVPPDSAAACAAALPGA